MLVILYESYNIKKDDEFDIHMRVFSNNFKILGGPEKGRLKEFKDFMKFQSLKTLEAYPGADS